MDIIMDTTDRSGEDDESLRDWFAGQALIGLIARAVTLPPIPIKQRAIDAYKYADAMLEARQHAQVGTGGDR